jgi:hypothetical protein
MSDNLNIFDTIELVGVVPNLLLSQNWMIDNFFTNIVESTTEKVAIDVDVGKRRMAPFVSPLVAGKLVESRRMQTNEFTPAYIKDKRVPDLRKPIKRQLGERIGGSYTGAERAMLNIQNEMADQIDILNRRMEWMGCSALTSGTVTIRGEGFPETLVDFGRDPDLTITLTSTDVWPSTVAAGATNTQPTDDIEEWQVLVLQKSGSVPTDIIFTNASWKRFKLDTTLKGAIIAPALTPTGNIINPGAQAQLGAVCKGYWGNFTLWLYNDWYIDDITGEEMPMIPDGSVILTSKALMGTRAFGMILDPKFNYGPMAYAPKTWIEEDPAQQVLLMQSAPIIIPSRVNAALCATVV